MTVWILAQVKSPDGTQWEIGGVFSSRDKALDHAVGWYDAIWSQELDEYIGRETSIPPNVEWPNLEAKHGETNTGQS